MNSLVLNDHLYVAPYLVKFSNEAPIYHYFKTITKATGNQYKIDNKLYIDPILNYLPSYYIDNSKHCNLPINGKQLIPLINKKWDKKNMFINILSYCNKININAFDLIPLTIIVSNSRDVDNCLEAGRKKRKYFKGK